MSPLKRRSRNSSEGRTHLVSSFPLFLRSSFVFFILYLVSRCVTAGSLVGNLLPRLMLRERGVSVSSVKFEKTEANKPYINVVRSFFSKVWHLWWSRLNQVSSFRGTNQNLNLFPPPHLHKPHLVTSVCSVRFHPVLRYQMTDPGHDTHTINEIDDPVGGRSADHGLA